MMLEYLGDNKQCEAAASCGERLRNAVMQATGKEKGRGRDIGGSASTDDIASTIQDCLATS